MCPSVGAFNEVATGVASPIEAGQAHLTQKGSKASIKAQLALRSMGGSRRFLRRIHVLKSRLNGEGNDDHSRHDQTYAAYDAR